MEKTALKIIIPLYPGVKGDIDKVFYSTDGTYNKRHVYWLVPVIVRQPSGVALPRCKIEPTTQWFEKQFTINVWDKYLRARPKLMASIKFDVDANTYVVSVEPKYSCLRLTVEFNLERGPNGPHYNQALINQTPYMDWAYSKTIKGETTDE